MATSGSLTPAASQHTLTGIAMEPSLTFVTSRYQLLDPLGIGGIGIVHRAFDRLSGETVALKRPLLQSNDLFDNTPRGLDARLSLAREFQLLASLRHPNIVSVRDYGFESAGRPFFTMELIPAAQTLLEAGQAQPRSVQINYLFQLLQALAYLHRRGVLHCDLKPNNVLLAAGQVKVVDFGLSLMKGQSRQMAGTLAYLAPEVLNDQPPSPASDLFAVGILAAELLTGRHPFGLGQLSTLSDLIDNLLTGTPQLAGLPAPLAAVVERLLAKDPAARYPSAEATLHALTQAAAQPLPPETTAARESYLQAAHFVGRETELQTLSEAFTQTLTGRGSAWLIGGESGVGKTRLLNEVRTLVQVQGALVLQGQAVSTGGAAYNLWLTAARVLALAVAPEAGEAAVLQTLLPDIAELLEQPITPAPTLEPKAAQTRLHTTFANLILKQARRQPIALCLENLHQADAESLGLLNWLIRLLEQHHSLALFVIGTYADDEAPELPQRLTGMQTLKLARLSRASVSELSAAMLGSDGSRPHIVDFLNRETEGNAFFLVEVVRTLAEEAGALGDVAQMTLPTQVVSGGVQTVVQRRLNRAPAAARPLLELAAIAGSDLDLPALKVAAQQPGWAYAPGLEAWITDCANVAVLELRPEGWRFAHEKLRQGLLTGLSSERRQELHQAVATTIEAAYTDLSNQVAALAFHWGQAGVLAKEGHYARLAGEQAASRYANEEALRLLKRALELADLVDHLAQTQLQLGLGHVYQLVGQWPAAEDAYQAALQVAQAGGHLAEQGQGEYALAGLLMERGNYTEAHTWAAAALQTAQTTGDQSALSHALGTLGNIYWNQGDYPQALEHLERYLQLSQALGDPRGQSRAASGLGLVYWHKGDYARAREYYEQDLALATQIGDQAGVAKTLGNMGIIDWFLGAPSAALQRFHQQYTIAQQIGDRRVVGIALGNLGEIYRYQGDYASARLCYTHGLQVALEIGNRRGMMVAVGNLAILALLEDHDSAQALLQRAITLGRTLNIPYYLCEYLQLEARRMRALDLHAAQAANAEALQIAQQIGRKEILFAAQVLEAQLNNGLGQSSPALEALQATWTDPAQQAALAYARWQLDGSPAQRAEACRQYRALYEKSPLLEYRQHWTELAEPGADPLPAPPQLPPPPEALAEAPVDKMLAQVDALIESLSRPSRNLGP